MIRDRLHPHSLPDAALCGIPHPASLQRLLSFCVIRRVRKIPHQDLQQILPSDGKFCHVQRKGKITAHMSAGSLSVPVYFASLVYRPEMQKIPVSVPLFRQNDRSCVMQKFVRLQLPVYAGQRSLRRKGHQDPSLIFFRVFFLFRNGIVPVSVQDQAVLPHQPRSWIFLKNMLRIQRAAPPGIQLFSHQMLRSFLCFICPAAVPRGQVPRLPDHGTCPHGSTVRS